jgi:hypothetical protein
MVVSSSSLTLILTGTCRSHQGGRRRLYGYVELGDGALAGAMGDAMCEVGGIGVYRY